MISLNAVYTKLLLSALHIKREKNVIHAGEQKNLIETMSNNIFVILMIFKNNTVNV